MTVGIRRVAGALTLLAGSALADPFTGRYNIESVAHPSGISISGFIDFVNAPMGTSAFNLDAPFITGFSIVASGPTSDTLTWNTLAVAQVIFQPTPMPFDAALGSAILNPGKPQDPDAAQWLGLGDLDGQGDPGDYVALVVLSDAIASSFGGLAWYWITLNDSQLVTVMALTRSDAPPWRLVLQAAPVPEPGTLVLCGVMLLGLAFHLRRCRRNRPLASCE